MLLHAGEKPAPLPGSAELLALMERDSAVDRHLATLCEEHAPRLTGSLASDRAAQWCLEQFQSYGLSAKLEVFGEFPVRFDRGVQRGVLHKGGAAPLELDFLTRSWTRGTSGVERGPAVLEPGSAEELERDAARFVGAWIIKPQSRSENRALAKLLEDAYAQHKPLGFVRSGRKGGLLVMNGDHRVRYEELDTKRRNVEITLREDQYSALVADLVAGVECQLEFEIDALKAISAQAIKRNTGARGLRSIMEGLLLGTMFDLPDMKDISKVVITPDVVEGKASPTLVEQTDETPKKKKALPKEKTA
jgi:hypothetical protein